MSSPADRFLTIRLDAALHEQLKAAASRSERTVAAEVRLAIRDRLEREESK